MSWLWTPDGAPFKELCRNGTATSADVLRLALPHTQRAPGTEGQESVSYLPSDERTNIFLFHPNCIF